MSFGWSLGDIFAGIKILWDVYDSVSDGPLNARLECDQFFEEFSHIIQCLDDWDRKSQVVHDDSLAKLHLQLRAQCETFIGRHMRLIQSANPVTESSREGQPTWLRKVAFSREQVAVLYQKVRWPLERKEVTRLRKKLMLFLALSQHHVSTSTHNVTVENRDILLDIRASNLEVVNKNLDLVSLIINNLRRLTEPLEPGHQTSQIDYLTLRQFERALLPPQPIRAIEANPRRPTLQFLRHDRTQIEEGRREYAVAASTGSSQESITLEQDNRVLLSERLQNFRQRSARTLDSSSNSNSGDRSSIIRQLLERLRDTRTHIGDVVGMPTANNSEDRLNLTISDPRSALVEELGIWDTFEERVQYEVQRRENLVVQAATHGSPNIVHTEPISIPSSVSPTTLSPISSPPAASSSEGWYGSPGSPQSNRGSFLHNRSPSTSSSSPAPSIRLVRSFPVIMQYQNQALQGSVQYCSRSDDGEIICITTISQDGCTEVQHSLDHSTVSDVETSMKPYLDNGHVDTVHKYRVNFLGSHVLRIIKIDSQGHRKAQTKKTQPRYKFGNRADYYEFQQLLLNKDIALITDIQLITSKGEPQCRLVTIRVLVEPIYKSRSILYFRGCKTRDHKTSAFVEWPINLFKVLKEPSARCKTLTIESADGRSLSFSDGSLSRRSTQGSITTIASFETENVAHSRLQERANSRGIKALTIDFYDPRDCHEFWKEFVTNDGQFNLPNPAL